MNVKRGRYFSAIICFKTVESVPPKKLQNHIFSPLLSLLSRRHHIHNVGVVVIRVGIRVVVACRVDVCLVQVVVVVVDVVVDVDNQGEDTDDKADIVERVAAPQDAVHVHALPELLLLAHVHRWHVPLCPRIYANVHLLEFHRLLKDQPLLFILQQFVFLLLENLIEEIETV